MWRCRCRTVSVFFMRWGQSEEAGRLQRRLRDRVERWSDARAGKCPMQSSQVLGHSLLHGRHNIPPHYGSCPSVCPSVRLSVCLSVSRSPSCKTTTFCIAWVQPGWDNFHGKRLKVKVIESQKRAEKDAHLVTWCEREAWLVTHWKSIDTPSSIKAIGTTLLWTITTVFPGGFLQFFYQCKLEPMLYRGVAKIITSPNCFQDHKK